MNFHILTLFPDMVSDGLHTSILGRAVENGHISMNVVNIRDYTLDKHKKVDDYPYGGGAGMLMQAQPIYDAWLAICEQMNDAAFVSEVKLDEKTEDVLAANETQTDVTCSIGTKSQEDVQNAKRAGSIKKPRTVYVTPQGSVFNQSMAVDFAKEEDLVILCGHYEGVDERVLEEIVTDYVSIGDYVLTGGELPAMVMVDAISRMVPGVLSNEDSGVTESFYDNLLEYPQYSRPEIWHEKRVPDVLLSGHHKKIEEWRKEQSIKRTQERRPDLYEKYLANKQ